MNQKLIISIGEDKVHIIRGKKLFGKDSEDNITNLSIDDGIVSDGTIRDPIALSGVIQEFMEGLPFKFLYEIVFLLNSSRVIIKEIHIPRVKLKNLKGIMVNRIDELFPDIREFNFRYRIKEENESGFDMQVVFIPKDLYNGYNDVLKSLKILKGTLDVQYSALESFVKEGGLINGEKLKDGEYLLVSMKDSNGFITQCSKGVINSYRNIYHPSGGKELRKKILDTLYFDDFERDRKIILFGEGKEYLLKDIQHSFNVTSIIVDKIAFHNEEVEESEINGCLDIFSRVFSKKEKKDYRVNFFSGNEERKSRKIIFKGIFVVCLFLFFMLYSINLHRALKYDMNKLKSLNEKGFALMDESNYEKNKLEENDLNITTLGKGDDLKKVISLVQKYAKLREIAFDGYKYNVKGIGEEITCLGELIKALQKDEYKKSHLIGVNKHSGETWNFQIEIIR